MFLQLKYLILVLSFVLGSAVASLGQSPIVKNPHAQLSSQTNFKNSERVTGTAQSKTLKSKTAATRTAQSKKVLKPIANTGSPIRGFEYFVPEAADLLIVLRPQQAGRDELLSLVASNVGAGMPSSGLPVDIEKVEWVIAATAQKTVNQIKTSAYKNAFDDIAMQLDAAFEGEQPKRPKRNQRSNANELNENTCSLIRFTEPTQLQVFGKWLDYRNDGCGKYQQSKWLGHETLECGSADCCVVVRLDEKTFLIGSKEHLGAAFRSKDPPTSKVAKWAKELAKSNFRGELFVGAEFSAMDWGAFFTEPDGPLKLLNSLRSVQYSVDLKTAKLFECKVGFDNAESAKQFEKECEKAVESYFKFAESMQSEQLGNRELELYRSWQGNQFLKLARSITFTRNDTHMTVRLPRPVGLADTLKSMKLKLAEFQKQQEAEFQSIQRKLDQPHPAFGEAKVKTLRRRSEPAIKMKPVLVSKREIKKGKKIRAEDVTIENWPAQLVPEDALSKKNEVVGKISKHRFNPGMPIQDYDLEPVSQ